MGVLNIASNVQGAIGTVKNAVNAVLSMFGVDVVGIYDNNTFAQLFKTARPIKANISRDRKIMDHPIETGALVSDFAITMPVSIELSMMLTGEEYAAVYKQIKRYFLASVLVSVQTKADVFPNMLIQAMPHEEDAAMFDAIPLALKLRQVQQVKVQYQALPPQQVAAPQDQSTVNAGVQQPKQQSALLQLKNFVVGK